MGYSYDYSYGVNKLLDGKRRFLKPDYHYTEIFWLPRTRLSLHYNILPRKPTLGTQRYVAFTFSFTFTCSFTFTFFVYVFVYVCVFVYVRFSKSVIYDIGTEITIVHCFATKMLKSFCKSMIFSGICNIFCVLYFCSIKT